MTLKRRYNINSKQFKKALPILYSLSSPSIGHNQKKLILSESPLPVINLLCRLLRLLINLSLTKQLKPGVQEKLKRCLRSKKSFFRAIINPKLSPQRRKALLISEQKGSGLPLIPLAISAILPHIIKAFSRK